MEINIIYFRLLGLPLTHLLWSNKKTFASYKMAESTYQCNPGLKRRAGEPCLPLDAIQRLTQKWNETHPGHAIKPIQTRRNRHASGKNQSVHRKTWKQLRTAMKSHYKCDNDYCIVKKLPGLSDTNRKELIPYFRPERPKAWDSKLNTWLDSYNLEDVMRQYEQADPSFEFIGPVPIDFDSKNEQWGKCIVDELCKLNLSEVAAKGKKKIGIIFNLDKHDEPGSHWVCAFVDIVNKKAYYFDSYGYKPEPEIEAFLERCKDQGCDGIYWNDIRHQREGSECGMYCLYVIISLLNGKPFDVICKNIVPDKLMNLCRDVLFAEETPRKEALDKALPLLTATVSPALKEKI